MKRVFILLFISCIMLESMGQKNPCNPSGAPYTQLPGDTTIVLPHGTQLTFNRCEYFDKRECLNIIEAYDIESIRSQNLTTLDRDGNVLLSAGMFCLQLTGDCAKTPCFQVPVKIKMPLPSAAAGANGCGKCERGTFRLYNSNNGRWTDSSNNNFRITDSAGKSWIEFTAYCGNLCYNSDCCINYNAGKTKIKVKGIHKLDNVEITTECPVGVLKYSPKKGQKKVIARLPCYASNSVKISAKGSNGNDEVISTPSYTVNELEHSKGKRNCNSGKKGKRTKTGSFYKRYIIRF